MCTHLFSHTCSRDHLSITNYPTISPCEIYTVPKFNSCTKCVDSPAIIHDCTPDCTPLSMTSQLSVAFIHTLRWSLKCLGLMFWLVINGCLYNQAHSDVRSTSAGIERTFNISNFTFYLRSPSTMIWSVLENIEIDVNAIKDAWSDVDESISCAQCTYTFPTHIWLTWYQFHCMTSINKAFIVSMTFAFLLENAMLVNVSLWRRAQIIRFKMQALKAVSCYV